MRFNDQWSIEWEQIVLIPKNEMYSKYPRKYLLNTVKSNGIEIDHGMVIGVALFNKLGLVDSIADNISLWFLLALLSLLCTVFSSTNKVWYAMFSGGRYIKSIPHSILKHATSPFHNQSFGKFYFLMNLLILHNYDLWVDKISYRKMFAF